MPKVTNTRKHKAEELLRLLTNGPAFCALQFSGREITGADFEREASAGFKRWSESWVLHLVCDLVPELKGVDAIGDRLGAISRAATKESSK